jgi:hypothetical protein
MSQWRLKNPSSAPVAYGFIFLSQSHSPQVNSPARKRFGHAWAFWAVRLTLISFSVLLCYSLGPFGFHGLPAGGIGFLVAMVILLAELRMRHAELSGLMGGVLGGVLGLLASLLFTLIVSRTAEPDSTKSFLEFTSLFALGYLGLVVGKGPPTPTGPVARIGPVVGPGSGADETARHQCAH